MLGELMVSLKPEFTQEDKEACTPVIERVIELIKNARKHGLILWSTALNPEEVGSFLGEAIEIVSNRYSGDGDKETEELFAHMILAENSSGAGLLGQFIIAEGILVPGESPRETKRRLTAMLGASYLERFKTDAEMAHRYTDRRFYMEESNCVKSKSFAKLKELLAYTPDETLKTTLKEVLAEGADGIGTINAALNMLEFDACRKFIAVLPGKLQVENYRGYISDFGKCEHAIDNLNTALENNNGARE